VTRERRRRRSVLVARVELEAAERVEVQVAAGGHQGKDTYMASQRTTLRVFAHICAMMVFAAIVWSWPDRHSSIYDLDYLVGPPCRMCMPGTACWHR
jgi:hypothetical protein